MLLSCAKGLTHRRRHLAVMLDDLRRIFQVAESERQPHRVEAELLDAIDICGEVLRHAVFPLPKPLEGREAASHRQCTLLILRLALLQASPSSGAQPATLICDICHLTKLIDTTSLRIEN